MAEEDTLAMVQEEAEGDTTNVQEEEDQVTVQEEEGNHFLTTTLIF